MDEIKRSFSLIPYPELSWRFFFQSHILRVIHVTAIAAQSPRSDCVTNSCLNMNYSIPNLFGESLRPLRWNGRCRRGSIVLAMKSSSHRWVFRWCGVWRSCIVQRQQRLKATKTFMRQIGTGYTQLTKRGWSRIEMKTNMVMNNVGVR